MESNNQPVSDRRRQQNRESVKRWRDANPDKARAATQCWRDANRERVREKNRSWRAANPARAKEHSRRQRTVQKDVIKVRKRADHVRRYGITIEQWDSMLVAQGGKCAACRSDDPSHKYGWATDHCHATGKVRGILCQPCNCALGHAKEDAARLQALAAYIASFNTEK